MRFILLTLLCSLVGAQLLRANEPLSLSQLNELVLTLRKSGVVGPDQSLYVVGGSANAVLDHIRYKKPLLMRDFDISFANPNMDQETAMIYSRLLQTYGLTREKRVEPKSWAHGWGIFHTVLSYPLVLDLIIYRDLEDLFSKGGILNTEKVKIEIPPNQDLLSVAEYLKSQNKPFGRTSEFLENQFIDDRYRGFISWKMERPEIIQWSEVRSNPVVSSMRIVRAFERIGADLYSEDLDRIAEAFRKKDTVVNSEKAYRQFSYALADDTFARQLKNLQRVGLFKRFLPSLNKFLFESTTQEIQLWLELSDTNSELSIEGKIIERLRIVSSVLSPEDKQIFVSKLSVFYDLDQNYSTELNCKLILK